MTQYTRPSNVPAWAESGATVQPTDAEIQAGWPASNVPPSRQRFNWILNWLANAARYFLQLGVPEWSATESYVAGARVQTGGVTYKALAASTNVTPGTNASKWEKWGFLDSEIQPRVDKLLTKSVAGGADVTLSAAEADNGILVFTGTLTGNINVIVPNAARRWNVKNSTTGAFSLTVKTASGAGVSIPQASAGAAVFCDGANFVYSATGDNSTYAPINSPTFTGSPSAPTPAQFDNDTSIATTRFVKSNGVSYAASIGLAVSRNMAASDIGCDLIATANLTYTVLSGASFGLRPGDSVTLSSFALNTMTVDFSGCTYMGGLTASLTVKPFESMTLIYEGSSSWRIVNSTATLDLSGSFGSSLTANGYQKLPSGLIIQWGTFPSTGIGATSVVTLPIAFPTSNLMAVASPSTANAFATVQGKTASSVTIGINGSAASGGYWIAIGY